MGTDQSQEPTEPQSSVSSASVLFDGYDSADEFLARSGCLMQECDSKESGTHSEETTTAPLKLEMDTEDSSSENESERTSALSEIRSLLSSAASNEPSVVEFVDASATTSTCGRFSPLRRNSLATVETELTPEMALQPSAVDAEADDWQPHVRRFVDFEEYSKMKQVLFRMANEMDTRWHSQASKDAKSRLSLSFSAPRRKVPPPKKRVSVSSIPSAPRRKLPSLSSSKKVSRSYSQPQSKLSGDLLKAVQLEVDSCSPEPRLPLPMAIRMDDDMLAPFEGSTQSSTQSSSPRLTPLSAATVTLEIGHAHSHSLPQSPRLSAATLRGEEDKGAVAGRRGVVLQELGRVQREQVAARPSVDERRRVSQPLRVNESGQTAVISALRQRFQDEEKTKAIVDDDSVEHSTGARHSRRKRFAPVLGDDETETMSLPSQFTSSKSDSLTIASVGIDSASKRSQASAGQKAGGAPTMLAMVAMAAISEENATEDAVLSDAKFAKYAKMKKIKIPMASIKNRMRMDGLSAEDIALFTGEGVVKAKDYSKHPILKKYAMLKKLGTPMNAIFNRMKLDGIDKVLIQEFCQGEDGAVDTVAIGGLQHGECSSGRRHVRNPSWIFTVSPKKKTDKKLKGVHWKSVQYDESVVKGSLWEKVHRQMTKGESGVKVQAKAA